MPNLFEKHRKRIEREDARMPKEILAMLYPPPSSSATIGPPSRPANIPATCASIGAPSADVPALCGPSSATGFPSI